jgi:hypothetical protein
LELDVIEIGSRYPGLSVSQGQGDITIGYQMPFAQNGEWKLLFFVRLAIELTIAGSQAAVSFSGGLANVGVAGAVARDHLEEGRGSAFLAARVMRGENPVHIPFAISKKTKLVVNLAVVKEYRCIRPETYCTG